MVRWSKRVAVCLLAAMALLPGAALAEWIDLGGGDPVSVQVLQDDASRTVLEITVGGFEATPVTIDGTTYYQIGVPREGNAMEPGLPQLPNVRRSVVIPDDRDMMVNVLASEHRDFADLPVAPSKGHILRTVDPATVPYTVSSFYSSQEVYPATVVEHEAPYILRDVRGLLVDANVFQYDAGHRSLRVYTRLVIEITDAGPSHTNVLARTTPLTTVDPQFANLYRNHFVNGGASLRYTPVEEDGGMLIIAYDAFASYMEPLVAWKNQKGIPTRLVNLSTIGSTYTQIAAYILNAYQTEHIAYVLLVGDGEQMPKYGSDSDPVYALVAGSDSYPDLFVGRFSAETPAHVQTQVARTIAYERDTPAGIGSQWAQQALGVASNQGPGHFGEYDYQHIDNIRADLLGYGYSAVDQVYDPTGTAAMVATSLNAGRGFINYCGHGSQTSWGSTGFSNTHVNALTNQGMLPFITSVACNNGTFTGGTCFAEAWLRAQQGGQATGAIATYMSYISQSWDPPMYAEDEAADLLVADARRTTGGLWFNGSCAMIDASGAQGITEFRNWMIFGDPSLCVRTKAATPLTVNHTGVLLIGMNQYTVDVPGVSDAVCALYGDGTLYGAATTDAAGHAVINLASPPTAPMTLSLTVTAYNKVSSVTSIPVLPPEGPYLVFGAATVDGNGLLDYAETAGVTIALQNVGVEGATGITAVLSTTDPAVTIADGAVSFPDIPAGTVGTALAAVPVTVGSDVADGHPVQFAVTITAANGAWNTTFPLVVQAPVLSLVDWTIDDDGPGCDRDGIADPGETFGFSVRLANNGHAAAGQLAGTIELQGAYAAVVSGAATGGSIPVGGQGTLSGYALAIDPACPVPTNIAFSVGVTGGGLPMVTVWNQFTVGGWYDDFETNRGWIGGLASDTATAGRWERAVPQATTNTSGLPVQPGADHTPTPGTLCWVTGATGGTAGDSDLDGGTTTLLSPVFDLAGATAATFSYWRIYSNNMGNNPNTDWWTVQVTSDGSTWVDLERTQASSLAWTQFSFDLENFVTLTDHVQVRFVADDTAPSSLVEALVDDVFLSVTRDLSTPVEEPSLLPASLVLGENYPNPFNPKTTIRFDLPQTGRVELAVFDLAGRKVATLVNEPLTAGHHAVTWLGQDDAGRRVASGTYVYRLQAGAEVLTRKMMMLK